MYRIDNGTSITPIPAPAAVGPNPNSFFTKGNPATSLAATIVDDDWLNAVQEEICNFILASGVPLDKTKRDQMKTALLGPLARIRMTANTTFYVRSDGSDANSGLVNSAGGAKLTLQAASDLLTNNYDFVGFQASITIGTNATYAGATFYACTGQKVAISITGLSTAGTIFNSAIFSTIGARVQLSTMKFAGGLNGVIASGVATLLTGIEFGATVGANSSQLYASGRTGLVQIANSYTISGGSDAHITCFSGEVAVGGGITVTLTGTPAFGTFVSCGNMGFISFSSQGGQVIFTGAATGVRYTIANLSCVSTNGSGASYLPGNSAGSTLGGGVYN